MLLYLIQGITFGFAAAVQPGPFQTYLLSRALHHGWRRTLPAAFAPLVSDGPIILLVLVVLNSIPVWWERILQAAGGVFLLYLAFGTFKSWRDFSMKSSPVAESGGMSLLKASLVNVLNPNPYLGWMLVMGPLLMKGWREAPAHGIALMIGFYGTIVLGGAAIVILFSSARALGPQLNRSLLGISAIGLALLGLYQLWQGTTGSWL
ncbi:MAG: LysE family transporter [Ignavibacteriales bacterium]|nr:LysE family transporter [Ignavibacteriales bacterium]